MRNILLILLAAYLSNVSTSAFSQDQQTDIASLPWQRGPVVAKIGEMATINVPAGYMFLDAENTKIFDRINGNPPVEGFHTVMPETGAWFGQFYFDETGYVKDDEKLDPDDLLSSLKSSDKAGNEERVRLGMGKLYTDGWAVVPHYDEDSKHLEYGIRLRDEDGNLLQNYKIRLLGRSGVMNALLVGDIESLDSDLRDFRTVIANYQFIPDQTYSAYQPGDKVAEYGLAALVLGGAAAVASKKGFWAVLAGFIASAWKFIIALGVAALAGIAKLFGKKNS